MIIFVVETFTNKLSTKALGIRADCFVLVLGSRKVTTKPPPLTKPFQVRFIAVGRCVVAQFEGGWSSSNVVGNEGSWVANTQDCFRIECAFESHEMFYLLGSRWDLLVPPVRHNFCLESTCGICCYRIWSVVP